MWRRFIIAACAAGALTLGCAEDDATPNQGTDTAQATDTTQATGADTAQGADAEPDGAEQPQGAQATSSTGAHMAWAKGLDGPVTVGEVRTAQVSVQDATGQAAAGLALEVAYIQVGMGHGGVKVPYVEEVGEGVYTVGDLQASMAGQWALTLTLGDGEELTWQVTVQ